MLVAIGCRTPDPPPVERAVEVAGAGQSNMEGSANGLPGFPIPSGTELYDHGLPREAFGQGAGLGLHHGPEAGFLWEMAAAGIETRFVKHAVAGTPISQWIEDYAEELVEQTDALEVRPDVLIWMHGGGDSQSPRLAEEYPDRLAELIGVFREAWGPELLVVVVGFRAEAGELYPFADQIREVQQEYTADDPHALYLDVMDAATAPDFHMGGTSPGCDPDPEGVGLVGRRAAAAVLSRLFQPG